MERLTAKKNDKYAIKVENIGVRLQWKGKEKNQQLVLVQQTNKMIDKTGKLEDILEKYHIEDLKSLEEGLDRLEKLEKVFEILKKNLIVKVDEGAKNKDVSCLVIAMKTMDDNLAILYETFDEEKIKLLKEVFK